MKRLKYIGEILFIVILAAIGAVNYAIFIFPNQFAPAGLDGLCTMFQDLTGINIGYSSLLINLPLLIIAFRHLDKDYAIKNIAFILSFSVVSAVIGKLDLSGFYFYSENSTTVVLAPVVAGVIRGTLYAFTLGLNGASGGIDIIAALIRKQHPHFNLMNIIFAINMFVAVCSYFVYGNQLIPVVCGIIYFYITSQTSTQIQVSKKENAKIEIITQDAGQICAELDAAFPPPESITLSFEECCDAYALPGDQVLSAAGHIPFNRLDYAALAVFCMADEKAAREAEQACTARADQVIRLYILLPDSSLERLKGATIPCPCVRSVPGSSWRANRPSSPP